ncbi:MAG: glycosyltransferase [Desulfovibrio sp.]|uniref:glycosyltransferase family 2 protein n=1 Tax=Desulfovibrio sp. TaxID=885 RepID=UPI0039E639BA
MPSPPLVSVIIPTYNYARFLSEAVRSVLSQKTDNLNVEIIVVDDGSTDDTQDVAKTLGTGVTYVRQDNQGLAAARNTGLRAAHGDFVAFLDADDLYTEDVLTSQMKVFAEQPHLDMVICRCAEKRDEEDSGPMHLWPLVNSHWDIHSCHSNLAPVHCHLTRMDLVRRVGFFDTALKSCEDHDFWLRCYGIGCQAGVNPLGLVIYRKHGDNMTHNSERMFFHDALMHLKVRSMLDGIPSYPSDKLAGWLAHAAACLFSMGTMAFNRDMSNKMQDFFVQAVHRAVALNKEGGEAEAQLLRIRTHYVVKCLLSALSLESILSPQAAKAVMILKRLFPRVGQLAPKALEARLHSGFLRLCVPSLALQPCGE